MNVLDELKKKVSYLPEMAREIVITNDEQLVEANQFLLLIKNRQKEINNIFNPMIKKINEAHREAFATKRIFEIPARAAEQHIKSQIAPYLMEKENIRKEAELRAQREREEAEESTSEEAPEEQIVPEKIKLEGTSLRKNWRWKIADLSEIPRSYMILNETLINKIVREEKNRTEIPGIEVYVEETISSRGG